MRRHHTRLQGRLLSSGREYSKSCSGFHNILRRRFLSRFLGRIRALSWSSLRLIPRIYLRIDHNQSWCKRATVVGGGFCCLGGWGSGDDALGNRLRARELAGLRCRSPGHVTIFTRSSAGRSMAPSEGLGVTRTLRAWGDIASTAWNHVE